MNEWSEPDDDVSPYPAYQSLVNGEVSLGLTGVDTPAASSGQLTGVMK